MSVASYQGLPYPALAFLGEAPDMLYTYATFLVEPGSEVTLLVNAEQRPIVEQAFIVSEIIPEWQMCFRGDPDLLDPGDAEPLQSKQIPAMQKLAQIVGLTSLEDNPLAHGPAYGVWEGRTLAAMGSTHLSIPQAVEIGNIATHPDYRRQGYAANVISALVRASMKRAETVFLMVYQSNVEAVRLYERMGFERERPMYLIHCLVDERPPSTTGSTDQTSKRGQA
jgi:ribosomal protein S18 acetylase RimI-like enzyme